MANTIDGGEGASKEKKAASLLGGCGRLGGQVQVTVNPKDPAYNTKAYLASKAKPKGIIIKLVRDPKFKGN
ncbi:hypothetical protein FOBRF1_006517 [Fusarium oxysporum]